MRSTPEQRKQWRALANTICATLAKKLGRPAPVCSRITQRRGFAYPWLNSFSVPEGAFTGHPSFTIYYVTHEATHCFVNDGGRHTPAFKKLEAELCEQQGIRIKRQAGPNGYADQLLSVEDGTPLCDKHGQLINNSVWFYEI